MALSLLQTYGIPSSRGKSHLPPTEDSRYDGRNHWPEFIEKQRRCGNCGKKANFQCINCKIALHPKSCFHNYHVQSPL